MDIELRGKIGKANHLLWESSFGIFAIYVLMIGIGFSSSGDSKRMKCPVHITIARAPFPMSNYRGKTEYSVFCMQYISKNINIFSVTSILGYKVVAP